MKDFEFSLPTKIIFGKNAQDKIGSMSAGVGRRALIVYGSGRIIKNGLLDELQGHLKDAGVDSRPFGGVCENPLLSFILINFHCRRPESNRYGRISPAGF